MDILAVPFHRFLDIRSYPGDEYIFEIHERPEYLNHLGTIHACVQLSLAEASSGEFLLQQFREFESKVIPVIRKTEVKYHRPANGSLVSRTSFPSTNKEEVLEELRNKNRTIIQIKVEVFDSSKSRVLTAVFDWFMKIVQQS